MTVVHRVALALALLVGVAAFGCNQNARLLRATTYPPSFRYISDGEIESVMWRLASSVHQLESAGDTNDGNDADVASVSRLLLQIERDAKTLSSNGASSNHPYLQTNLQEFLGLVAKARRDLLRTPPQTITSDDVWRACSGCHNRI
ncbi:MAG: hypothetical protein ACI8W3_003623 [Myxococcota bacterium]|jgi:hypothetical protein